MSDLGLTVVAGIMEAKSLRLRLPATLGRGRDMTLRIPQPLVSRRHCELYEKDGQVIVRDLGSLNGTFVGKDRVDQRGLTTGDLLTVGMVTFRVHCSMTAKCEHADVNGDDETVVHDVTEPNVRRNVDSREMAAQQALRGSPDSALVAKADNQS